MALVAEFVRDRRLRAEIGSAISTSGHAFASSPSWSAYMRLLRERPATIAVVDLASLPYQCGCDQPLVELRRSFPNLGLVLLISGRADPLALFRLGQAGIDNLVLLDVDDLHVELGRTLGRAARHAPPALVMRAVTPYLPRRQTLALHRALDGVHEQWSAGEFASRCGLSRPFLSECLKAYGLPSAGHLLLWSRLLHAGHWLVEPGRTGESVSRQLEYANGATFRRALKAYTGATPTQVVERGGLRFVLGCFLRSCGFERRRMASRASVA